MTSKIIKILLNAVPVILMIALILPVQNDFLLTATYAAIIVAAFSVRREKNDHVFFIFGLVAITLSELFFVSTGVEVFRRASLLGLIPLWLPFLWAYAFVAIKRSIVILNV